MNKIEQKRKLLWEKLCAREQRKKGESQSNIDRILPDWLPIGSVELLTAMLVRRKFAFVYENIVSQCIKCERRIILKTTKGYEFGIGNGNSGFAQASLFELVSKVLTIEEINNI